MPHTDLLKQFNLKTNPFVDRVAEKTKLEGSALYVHSDLRNFSPSETTYVFFGKRGSGKTTIRMQMQEEYSLENEHLKSAGKSRGHFMIDLCRPVHLTLCLRNFQDSIHCTDDNWDAQFGDSWTSADMVDCILCFAATELVGKLTNPSSQEGQEMLETIKSSPQAAKQMLVLAHLYANTDVASLAKIRAALLRPQYGVREAAIGASLAAASGAAVVATARNPKYADAVAAPFQRLASEVDEVVPAFGRHPRIALGAAAAATLAGIYYYNRYARRKAMERAIAITNSIRIVKQQPPHIIADILRTLFTPQDRVDTIRGMCIGISAHQKLDHLQQLVRLLGYESLCVFGDCFDEVSLLDPVSYPGAIKAFAREVCRNDLLNFGRLHFFFPDSRLALDLNTDKTLKEARFDRHFVRDLTWSRHQLEELAERRFIAAQTSRPGMLTSPSGTEIPLTADDRLPDGMRFPDLFQKVTQADFASYINKLSTPRELMIMMTEMMARIEANPEKGITAQDMEFAVQRALEQSL